MASPVNDSFSVASGVTMYCGRSNLPSWVPPSGYFADVPVTNLPSTLTPTIYAGDTQVMKRCYEDWGGGAWLRDFSLLGGYVLYSAGHEANDSAPNIQLTQVLDFSTLTWVVRNVPAQANSLISFQPYSGAANWPDVTTLGTPGYSTNDNTPYSPHTYNGLQEMPTAWGGGSKGTLVSFFFGGSGWRNRVNLMDVSQATGGYSKLTTTQAAQGANSGYISFAASGGVKGGSYPISAIDEIRQGWWTGSGGAQPDYTLFIHKSGTITQYPLIAGSNNLYDAVCYAPSLGTSGLVLGIRCGYDPSVAVQIGESQTIYKTLSILEASTGLAVTGVPFVTGTVPAHRAGFGGIGGASICFHAPIQLGLQWVEELGAIYGLDDTTDAANPVVVKLAPTGDPKTAPWAWSTVSLAHWTAGDPTGQAALQSVIFNVHSKFRWIPTLSAFVYASAADKKPQIIRV